MNLIQVSIHRSLNQPILILGTDWRVALFLTIACFGVPYIGMSIISVIIAIFLWISGFYILRLITKKDPKIFQKNLANIIIPPLFSRMGRAYGREVCGGPGTSRGLFLPLLYVCGIKYHFI